MSRFSALALFMMIGFGASGCGFINGLLNRDTDTAETPDASESTEAPDEAIVENEAPEDEAGDEAPETVAVDGVLPEVPTGRGAVPATLLESTDPNERLRAVERDRPDPYQYVPVSLPLPAPTPPPNGVPQILEEERLQEPDFFEDTTALLPDLPVIAEPTLVASEVQVSGIVQLNGADYVIVQAPGEPTPRHVRVGDRLSNGTILVKRIETRPGSEPVLVLEEQGLEIFLPAGSGTEAVNEPATQQNAQELVDAELISDHQISG
ncbi:MAG: hypothetical protein AAGH78_05140 [Cyanobacteria bacterium P01_H01_bin.58]